MDILIPLLQALGLDLVLMLFCYIMVGMPSMLGYDLYYYRGAGRFLPMGTADLKLWREGFHRSVRDQPEEATANYYVLRDREGMQLTLQHKLLLLAVTFSWSDVFLLLVLCLGHIVQTGDLDLLGIRLVPQLLIWLAVGLVGGGLCYLSVQRLRANIRPRRIFMNNVGAWLEKYDAANMVMGLSFFHALQKLLTPEELGKLVDGIPGLDPQGDPELGQELLLAFFQRLDERSGVSGHPWLFDLTQEGMEEYRHLSRILWPPEERKQ